METYANALLYAIPFFILLLGVEIAYGHFVKNQKYTVLDTVSSISSGLTNIIKDSLGIVLVLISYPFLLKHLAIISIEPVWITWVLGFVAIDFAGYWNHRLSHKINFFWNQHVIHHSSESFNLACALRQSVSNLLGYFPFLLIPAAILGVPNEVIAILAPIQLFAQFWYHTEHIGKMGWLEYVIVTPSQHRVHHAINPEYIDKNLGQIFCWWDRLFGTFQEELPNVPPQYGILKPARTWNPVKINFQHLGRLITDAWRTNSIKDKFRIWFMPTGWRPKDVIDRYPVEVITDVYNFQRYVTPSFKGFNAYVIFQLLFSLALLLIMFANFGSLSTTQSLLYGALIFLGIYGYTSLMDMDDYAVWLEIFRGTIGIGVIVYTGNWFGVFTHAFPGVAIVLAYYIATIIGAIYFSNQLKAKQILI